MSEPIRVAQIMGKWVGGGVESTIMNYYKHMDRKEVQFDFFFDSDSLDVPKQEIESLGGRVIFIPPYQKLFKYQKELKRIFKINNYKIVHSNINTLSVFPLRTAKHAGIPIRIAHSHSTTNKKDWKKNILKQVLRPLSKVYANQYFACSEEAGKWLFGDKTQITIINNAIEIQKFQYDKKIREIKRKELNISGNTLVIGNIGRFVKQKNHEFLLDIFKEVYKKNNNSVLVLAGKGPLLDSIKEKVTKMNLEKAVVFLGQRNDVEELYQAFDVFVFPTLYEGLGMVLIEAQCSGLPCISSNKVPKIVSINPNFKFMNLDESSETWAEEVLKISKDQKRITDITKIENSNFEIKKEAKKLEKIYQDLIFSLN